MIKKIKHKNKILALIIRAQFKKDGIEFFTPDNFSQQLAYMNHPAGKIIEPHIHNQIVRKVNYTQEVLFIKKGKLRVDFYDSNRSYLESQILSGGDVILLAADGHGFEVLEEVEMIEVKQGPYSGDNDKTRFHGVNNEKIIIKE
jgi:hypothetical protein